MELHNLPKLKMQRAQKRVGRGIGSGKGGHTSGRGHKGQKSRVGHNIPLGFEGGQVPLYKKIPHLAGFKNRRSAKVIALNILKLELVEGAKEITPLVLVEQGFIFGYDPRTAVKIIGGNKLKTKLTLKGFVYSESAKKQIEAAGGSAE